MAMVRFSVRSVDRELQRVKNDREPQFGGRAEFDARWRIDALPAPDLIVGDDEPALLARERAGRRSEVAQGFPIGELTFHDVLVAGPSGLVIDTDAREIWVGQVLGWSWDALCRFLRKNYDAVIDEDEQVVEIEERRLHAFRRLDDLYLLSTPGFSVYGHWLIDILPRLSTARALDVPAAHLAAPVLTEWQQTFGRLFAYNLTERVKLRPGRMFHVERLVLPTHIKQNQWLDRAAANATWAELADALRDQPLGEDLDPEAYGDRLYVSRKNWKHGRALSNAEEVEAHLRRRGFSVVHPEELSLRAQMEIFARARRVIGEDGSGMHNTIFSPPGCHLTVLNMHRVNIFHASIANAREHHLSYLQTEPDGEHWYLPIPTLDRHLADWP